MIRKRPSHNVAKRASEDLDREFLQIKRALADGAAQLESLVQSRFQSPKPWKFHSVDFVLQETGETIDLVFEHPAPDDPRFVLVHLSIPYLHKGQKFSLEARARQFQKQQGIAMSRVKKAILLIKRAGETINTSESRLHCPIIELEREALLPGSDGGKSPAPVIDPAQFSEALLGELKGAIARECLSTLAKRRNKYIRKGLWRWIEREIVDPNIHFFLVILSCIYQGNTSEVLSRRFKTLDDYTKTPGQVIDAIFSSETELATEITRNAERHRKALTKFLECFSQTPPFEYLKSLFLKEFRTCREGSKSRAQVFLTLKELLGRCGFQGEKEIQYPLEILDELNVFQGLMMGHYSELRIENATKKLRHLVPQIAWTTEDIYRLRDELARLFGLPPQEFNLNAFLPQAFVSALPLSSRASAALSTKRPAPFETHGGDRLPLDVPSSAPVCADDQMAPPPTTEITPEPILSRPESSVVPQPEPSPEPIPVETRPAPARGRRLRTPRKESVADLAVAPLGERNEETPSPAVESQPALPPAPKQEARGLFAKAPVQPHSSAGSGRGSSIQVSAQTAAAPMSQPAVSGPPQRPSPQGQPPQGRFDRSQGQPLMRRPGSEECDETKHRNFESFGGHLQTDEDSVRFAIEMDRFVHESALQAEAKARLQVEEGINGSLDDGVPEEEVMIKVSRQPDQARPNRDQGDRPRRRRPRQGRNNQNKRPQPQGQRPGGGPPRGR